MPHKYRSCRFILSRVVFIGLLATSCLTSDLNSNLRRTTGLDLSDSTAVFLFIDAECPVCRNYSGHYKEFMLSGVSTFFVFPGLQDTALIHEFMVYDSINTNRIIYDTAYRLCSILKAKVTPQAVVVQNGHIQYSGALDERVKNLGSFRQQSGKTYLINALNSLKNHERVDPAYIRPVGCLIESAPERMP